MEKKVRSNVESRNKVYKIFELPELSIEDIFVNRRSNKRKS